MEHPEPLEKAIAILRELDRDAYLYMLHRKEPIPLIALASEHNLNSFSHCDERGEWHILITPNEKAVLSELIKFDDKEDDAVTTR